jgi:hypothetical protein
VDESRKRIRYSGSVMFPGTVCPEIKTVNNKKPANTESSAIMETIAISIIGKSAEINPARLYTLLSRL